MAGELGVHKSCAARGARRCRVLNGRPAAGVICSGCLIFCVCVTWLQTRQLADVENSLEATSLFADTLVLYAFAFTDPEYLANLNYFVNTGIKVGDRCRYVIVLQQTTSFASIDLPPLPGNAAYVYHKNSCYDWGTYGWLLRTSGVVDYRQYKYFIFLNSSVRGPFLPIYLGGRMHWSEAFTRQLSDDVKLVGPTISCAKTPQRGKDPADPNTPWRQNPHLQSYAVGTDRVGLEVLFRAGEVFECHNERLDTIWSSELGAALAMLRAGHNIASFMVRYAGVDWRDKHTWRCNDGISSMAVDDSYDGITADPLEVMFVKVKSMQLEERLGFAVRAAKYQGWGAGHHVTAPRQVNISGNMYQEQQVQLKLPKILQHLVKGPDCFDWRYYTNNNLDLMLRDGDAAWDHFVLSGQFEERPSHFFCHQKVDLGMAATH